MAASASDYKDDFLNASFTEPERFHEWLLNCEFTAKQMKACIKYACALEITVQYECFARYRHLEEMPPEVQAGAAGERFQRPNYTFSPRSSAKGIVNQYYDVADQFAEFAYGEGKAFDRGETENGSGILGKAQNIVVSARNCDVVLQVPAIEKTHLRYPRVKWIVEKMNNMRRHCSSVGTKVSLEII